MLTKGRFILLFKGNFNNNNKWLSQVIMFNAEAHHLMVMVQYGSWKQKMAVIQCLNKWLLYNHAQYTHIPMAICSNNAKSCYDHIVLIIAALCLCQLGVGKPLVQSMLTTLYGMQHHVQSMYGNSTISQGRSHWGTPIASIGQGNGAGPQIWEAVSTPLFQILSEDGFFAQVICAMSVHQQSITNFRFVDNTNLCIATEDNTAKTVITRMQNSLQLWAGLLQATGGALVQDKCFWYHIQHKWNKRKGT